MNRLFYKVRKKQIELHRSAYEWLSANTGSNLFRTSHEIATSQLFSLELCYKMNSTIHGYATQERDMVDVYAKHLTMAALDDAQDICALAILGCEAGAEFFRRLDDDLQVERKKLAKD